MDTIQFTSLWNNRDKDSPSKIDLKSFTTIRLRNDKKYIKGKEYTVQLVKGKVSIEKGRAIIEDIYNFSLDKITNYVARQDSGYNKEEFIHLFKKMYSNATPPINWELQQISMILFVYNDKKAINEERE
jgi:hypothetical protein